MPLPSPPCRIACIAALVVSATGCFARNVVPTVETTRLRAMEPRIDRRAVLLLTPSFTGFTARHEDSDAITFTTFTHLGAAADTAFRAWAERSFARVDVRRVSETEALRLLVGGTGLDAGDVVLLPRLDGTLGGAESIMSPWFVTVRVDVRAMRSGAVHAWTVQGRARHTNESHPSGRALLAALTALTDTLARHRPGL